ncbi:t-SNARE [Atractiella rhizophila]|nr:t-SNARE [Atractiella rhizophila]
MSFADLERGAPMPRATVAPADSRGSKALLDRISIQTYKIEANVTGLNRVLELMKTRGGDDLRVRLTDLSEATKEVIKVSLPDVKALSTHPSRPEANKAAQDFQAAVGRFNKVQRSAAEFQRRKVDESRAALEGTTSSPIPPSSSSSRPSSPREEQVQHQIQMDLVSDADIEFQERVIEEREEALRHIESEVHEVNEIFRDLGTMVHQQQSMIDNIESNVYSVEQDTSGAVEELDQAHEYQKKAGRRMLCLLIIFIIVIAVVLLAVLA